MSRLVAGSLVFAVVAGIGFISRPSNPAEAGPKKPEQRKPWTTSRITGSPEPPPPYKAVRAFPNVKLDHPTLIARCPGSDRLFVGEQDGKLFSIAKMQDAKAELFLDLKKEIQTIGQHPKAKGFGVLYGLVFHPKFAENRHCYICYTLTPKDAKDSFLPDGTRVSRFTVKKSDPPRIDPASEEIIITWQGNGHNGGDLHFSPTDGMLYISTGDGRGPNPPDLLNTGQDCSDLLSSILRIDVDHPGDGKPGEQKPTGEPSGVSRRVNYSIPRDNPFVGLNGVRPEIWAFGFRNPWRMSFDSRGQLWVGDVGWELWEMVHRVEKGGNYGWSITEGRQPVKPKQKPGPAPIRPPVIELPHTIAASVTGGYVYRGKKFPELVGAYVFGDWETRRFWAARFEGDRLKEMPEILKPTVRPSCFGEDNAGELYFFDYDTGMLFTLDRNDPGARNANFPKKLSETGLFKDVKLGAIAEGVIQFIPNASQWQDGAGAQHLLALPGMSSITLFDKPRPLPGQVYWHNFSMQFPKDAVLAKNIWMDVVGKGRLRLETQILHFDGEDWHGYTYAWRKDESDADLVPAEGAEMALPGPASLLSDTGSGRQDWVFHSRNQCMTCHNAWAEYTLAFNIAQLNRDRKHLPDLVTLTELGYIQRVGPKQEPLPPFERKRVKKLPRLSDFYDNRVSGSDRVRTYLHVNCAHCHRFGGGGGQVVLELDHSKPLKDTGLLNERPRQGDFGLPDARLIASGDPYRSVLYYRMAKFGAGHMPHLGAERPDPVGLRHIGAWIAGLGDKKKAHPTKAYWDS